MKNEHYNHSEGLAQTSRPTLLGQALTEQMGFSCLFAAYASGAFFISGLGLWQHSRNHSIYGLNNSIHTHNCIKILLWGKIEVFP